MMDDDKSRGELLRVDSLRVKYIDPAGERDRVVLHGASLALRHGEVLAVTGQSGAGKSTLGHAIMGLLGRDLRVVSGRIDFDGARVETGSKADGGCAGLASARSGEAFIIFQEPRASLNPYVDIGAQVDECLTSRGGGLPQPEVTRRRHEVLSQVGIARDKSRSLPSELSTGQCQRVMIAMALALEAKLLVGDEPLARVDFRVGRQLTALLKTLKEQRRMSMLLLTHDLYLIRQLADRVAVIYGGEIVEEGPCEMVLGGAQAALHPYTRALCRAYDSFTIAEPTTKQPPAEGCSYAAQCPMRVDECLGDRPQFTESCQEHRVRCLFAEKK